MKKTIAVVALLVLLLQSCAVIRFTEDGQEISEQTRVFYVLSGLAPLSNNKFKAGKSYETKQDFVDVIISAFTSGIIYSHSVIPLSK